MKDLYLKRFSQRNFSEQIIDDETITEIMKWAQYAPSSLGLEGWKFLVISNKEIQEKMMAASWGQPQVKAASHVVILMSYKGSELNKDSQWLKDAANRRSDKTQEQIEQYVSTTVDQMRGGLQTDENISAWLSSQTYIAVGNLANGAKVNGVDSVIMEGFNGAAVREILVDHGVQGLDKYNINLMLPLGYAANPDQEVSKTRFDFDKVVEFIK